MAETGSLFWHQAESNRMVCGKHTPGAPVLVLPGAPADVERMVEQAWFAQGMLTHEEIRKVLASIGITQRGGKGEKV